MEADSTASPKRGRKACTECRQQKARCDAYIRQPCSRCIKVNTECLISDPFRRENKRQRLTELQHETEELRQQIESLSHPMGGTDTSNSVAGISSQQNTPSGNQKLNSVSPQQQAASDAPDQPSRINAKQTDTGLTQSRTLDGWTLEPFEIDDIFQLYFAEFSHYLPILDSSIKPNQYHDSSSFLFWMILGVACRAYNKNPTVLANLRSRITDLAFNVLKTSPTLEGVSGLLLIINWPFPRSRDTWNPNFILTGALLHAALAIGLHLPGSEQEFSKEKLQLTESDINHRAMIWAYCVLTYQRTCVAKGNSVLTLNDVCQEPLQRKTVLERVPQLARLQLRHQDTVSRCCKTLSEIGLLDITPDQEDVLDVMIRNFEAELENSIEASFQGDDPLRPLARLTIQSFHLFKSPGSYDTIMIGKLFNSACQVLKLLETVSKQGQTGLKSAPFYWLHSLLLSAQTILRLLKTSLSAWIDTQKAKDMVYLAINIGKSMSLENNDVASRVTTVMCQTLNSDRAFKDPDGSGAPAPLRIRSRSAVSLILDGTVWWREEFGGNSGVYPVPLKKSSNKARSANGTTATISPPVRPDHGFTPSLSAAVEMAPDPFYFMDPDWSGIDDSMAMFWGNPPMWPDLSSSTGVPQSLAPANMT